MNDNNRFVAEKIKRLLADVSPLIEEYTSRVCPGCSNVCCKQRHGVMNEQDARYLSALGAPLPAYDPRQSPDGPCQFMDKEGCAEPRWLRPWRCTAFFCDALLEAMNSGPQKKARQISALLQEIVDMRSAW